MKNFDEIKNLWEKAEPEKDLPNPSEIISKVIKTRNKMIRRNVLATILLCLTFVFILWIAFVYDFEMITTKLGLIIVLATIMFGVICNILLLRRLFDKTDVTSDANTYLHQMIAFRNKQRSVQTTGIKIYFIMLTAGLTLYEIEFAVRDLTFGIIYYLATLAWLGFVWFYLRKKNIAKHEKEITGQIESLESLTRSLQS